MTLDVEAEPIALLPMRLNADALSDLVLLTSGQSAPSVVRTAPSATFRDVAPDTPDGVINILDIMTVVARWGDEC